MTSWHKRLGEDGERLTILSVLPRVELSDAELLAARELPLREAIDELFRIAGDDEQAMVVVLRPSDAASGVAEPTVEQISLRDLADRLYGSFGHDGETPSRLRILGPDDDPLGAIDVTGDADGADGAHADGAVEPDDADSGVLGALRRFREAVHRLFGGSAEQGAPPTVLSLLVDLRATPDEPTDQA